MAFELLQARLIEILRTRIRNGTLTERGLARQTGISQPHIHNVLKGVRSFSSDISDLVLLRLGISIAELASESGGRSPRQVSDGSVPVLDGRIGPGHRFPAVSAERRLLPAADLAGIHDPVVARLARDEQLGAGFAPDSLALLDRSEPPRALLEVESVYAVERRGESLIRSVRMGAGCLYLLAACDRGARRKLAPAPPADWECVPLAGTTPLAIVRARVVWINSGSTRR